MACAIEDAGFEIRDMIAELYDSDEAFRNFVDTLDTEQLKALRRATDVNAMLHWCYGSGFPKSLNVGVAVNKKETGEADLHGEQAKDKPRIEVMNNKGTSEWEGWGTSLKPSHEPICMARKPLSEKTVAENVLKHGTGGINIDQSRIPTNGPGDYGGSKIGSGNIKNQNGSSFVIGEGKVVAEHPQGRFPANLIHDNSEEVRECFPETRTHKGEYKSSNAKSIFGIGEGQFNNKRVVSNGDSGNASRFFKSIIYVPKASKAERNKGCDGLEEKQVAYGNQQTAELKKGLPLSPNQGVGDSGVIKPQKNHHPTVKPVALMEYLINMVTRQGGTVLDPFMGSGSTGIACLNTNRNFIGIEKDEQYFIIAKTRIEEHNQPLQRTSCVKPTKNKWIL
jgi:hypothetical protein